jgi:sterol desaturase/sphingolipid hydroxylase (fatty acid hydroxylase superfamily)
MRDYVVLAIPFFFLLIALELVWARWQHRDYYRINDSVNDLSCGILSQLLEVFAKTALFAGYLFLYGSARLFDVPSGAAWAWVACFLGVDFFYYWFHRVSHERNALWAAHIVHHSSEEYNLAVALRQGALQGTFSWVFYLPLAVVGFPPAMFLACASFNTLYQFWIHTRTIGKLGPLEWFLNTPSHHRVHHACNPKYIDRNYAGVFIVWDRLFGSFKAEDEEPAFGITKPLRSWNPLWANLHYWAEMAAQARRSRRWADRLRVLVKPPGWRPEELGGFQAAPEIDRSSQRKFDPHIPRGLALYALVQFTVVLVFASLLLFKQDEWRWPALAAGTAASVGSLIGLGALMESRRWAAHVEATRAASLGVLSAVSLAPRGLGWAALAALAGLGLAAWVWRYRGAGAQLEPAAHAQTAKS